ncbi:regulatory protein SusR [Filimonas lacunae]|nr:regulatory protein SusR [Filimonas lacunae]
MFSGVCLFAQSNNKVLLQRLTQVIAQAPEYDSQQMKTITALKQLLQQSGNQTPAAKFALYARLFQAYKIFHYDSAYHYARLLQQTAHELNDKTSITYARIQLGFTFLSAGMYKEAEDSLSSLQVATEPDSIKAAYYSLMSRYYYDLGDFDNDAYHKPIYIRKGNIYIDSATRVLPDTSFEHQYLLGLRHIKAGNKPEALACFNQIIRRKALSNHELALATSTISDIYIRSNQPDSAIQLLAQAAIADIQTATKETSATFILAQLLYKQGDVKNASICINSAIADAVFYNARQRKVQVSSILPLIEAEKLGLVEKQRKSLFTYAVIVTLLFVAVIVLVVVVLRQVQKIKAAQQAIVEARDKEHAINGRLADANEKLADANKIKEEYIGYFFNVNAEFFNKMEKLKQSLEQKINDRRLDDIRYIVQNNINLKKEKQELLRHFDEAFLKLFPQFISEFNELFRPEDHIVLKEEELLNTDLRIFALLRMGIHDSEKVAHILQYSVNTINTYKTRIKNKSIVPNEQFDKRIMDIKTV